MNRGGTMTDQNGTKKFLYNDLKKPKGNEDEKQFHSRGYQPLGPSKLIDLEKVWSVKDLILEGGYKPLTEGGANASSSYYSRHGQYKSNKDTDKAMNAASSTPATWNPKNEINTKKSESSSGSPFDF